MRKLAVVALATAACVAALGAASPARADHTTPCVGVLTGGPYHNVVVPSGAICLLTNAIVENNVLVEPAAGLYAINNTIGNNVHGDDPLYVWMDRNSVGNNITVEHGGPHFHPVWICNTDVGRNVHLSQNVGDFITFGLGAGCAIGNRVDGSVHVSHNVVPGPGIDRFRIRSNTIDGHLTVLHNSGLGDKYVQGNVVAKHLRCLHNAPPFFGGPNVASRTQGQCF